jgi:hypothetical protein
MAERLTKRLVMPVLAAAVAVACAGAWFAPAPFLKPRSITGADTGAPPFPTFQRAKPPEFKNPAVQAKHDWVAVAETLEKLREKPNAVAAVPGPTPPPVSTQPVLPPLDWTYLGFAGSEHAPTAFVQIGTTQRVIFLNDQIPDEADPQGGTIKVSEILPERITLERGGERQTIEWSPPRRRMPAFSNDRQTSPRTPPMMGQPAPRGPLPNPGRRPLPGPVPGTPINPGAAIPTPDNPGVRAR